MGGIFNITIEEERGFRAVPADLDRLAVVLGCSSLGSGLSSFFLSGQSAIASVGYGDAVDTLCQVIEQRQESGSATKYPAALYTVPVDAAGSYGAIDDSGVTGLGVVAAHAATTPLGTYEAGLQWATSHVVGTAGGMVRSTLDGGRTWSTAVALGTATSYTIPNSGVRFDFSPSDIDTTALNVLITELKNDYNAHRILTAGPVHGAADSTNVVDEADATNAATRLALVNQIREMYTAHRILTAGGVHGAADTINVLTVPAATDDSTALELALEIQAEYNDHIALTAGGVHGLADGTNDSDSPAPDAGTFTAGDEVFVRTVAPAPSTAGVAAALAVLANASANFSIIVADFESDSAMLAVLTTGLNALAARGKRVRCLARAAMRNFESAETESAWAAAIIAEFVSFTDSRICLRAGYHFVTDSMTTRQYLRPNLQQFAADVVRVGRFGWPACPNDRAEPNVSLVDGSGVDYGHDEGPRGAVTGLSDDTLGNRFSCEMRLPDPNRIEDVFNTVPWVMYAADERIRNLMVRGLANAMEREAYSAAVPELGGKLFYTPTAAGTGVLSQKSRDLVQSVIYNALKGQFASEIDNAHEASGDTGLVQVSPSVTVTGGNLLTLTITLKPVVAGFVLSFAFTLSIQE